MTDSAITCGRTSNGRGRPLGATARLKRLVENAIVSNIDPRKWEVEQAIEDSERAGLHDLIGGAR